MKGFYRAPSQYLKMGRHSTKSLSGGRMATTEAQTLEQALHIIDVWQNDKKTADAVRSRAKQPSLAQELAWAKFISRGNNVSLANGEVHKGQRAIISDAARKKREARHVPHPYRDLPEESKPIKAREMLASGMWGLGSPAGRRLAILFAVDSPTMAKWLGIEIMSSKEYDAQFARKKP